MRTVPKPPSNADVLIEWTTYERQNRKARNTYVLEQRQERWRAEAKGKRTS